MELIKRLSPLLHNWYGCRRPVVSIDPDVVIPYWPRLLLKLLPLPLVLQLSFALQRSSRVTVQRPLLRVQAHWTVVWTALQWCLPLRRLPAPTSRLHALILLWWLTGLPVPELTCKVRACTITFLYFFYLSLVSKTIKDSTCIDLKFNSLKLIETIKEKFNRNLDRNTEEYQKKKPT